MFSASKSFIDSHARDTLTAHWGKQDVIIVVPPFASPRFPFLGPSVLLDDCIRQAISCGILYANLIFASTIGPDLYDRIVDCAPGVAFEKDAIFAPYAFDMQKEDFFRSVRDFQSDSAAIDNVTSEISPDDFTAIDGPIQRFLDYIVERLLKAKPAIVGFSTLSNQVTSSLAIARLIKKLAPGIITVMGGNFATRPIADGIIDAAPMIDYVFSGEADVEFPRFCKNFLFSGLLPASKLIECEPIHVMDSAKIPNFDDYFQQLRHLQGKDFAPKDWPDFIPFESSRGCWWGEKNRACFFCSSNTAKIRYRQKSRKRIVDEIAYLRQKHDTDLMLAADDVMPEDFEKVVDDLIDRHLDLKIFYEVRSTIEPSLMDKFVRAGIITLQPGIESLSTNVLKKMGKGITALQNLRLLRETRSRLIYVVWNFLVGVPGETREDYEPVLAILSAIEHLQPPTGVWRVCIDRYSRYFIDSATFGIRNLRPLAAYKHVYPANANLEQLAYHFTADFDSIRSNDLDLWKQIRVQCAEWIKSWECLKNLPSLSSVQTQSGWPVIKDTRKIARQTFTVLDKEAYHLLDILSEPTRTASIPERFQPYLPELLDRNFVIQYEGHYISLVTDPSIGMRLLRQRNSKSSHAKTCE